MIFQNVHLANNYVFPSIVGITIYQIYDRGELLGLIDNLKTVVTANGFYHVYGDISIIIYDITLLDSIYTILEEPFCNKNDDNKIFKIMRFKKEIMNDI